MALQVMGFPSFEEEMEEFCRPFANFGILRCHVGDESRDQLGAGRVENNEPDR